MAMQMECAQLQITGGGSAQPATVSFPGAYSGTDPGITINIYEHLSSYTVPGPGVFSCDGASSSAVPPPPPPASTASAPHSSAPASTTVAAPPPSGTSTATAAHYAQCGGSG